MHVLYSTAHVSSPYRNLVECLRPMVPDPKKQNLTFLSQIPELLSGDLRLYSQRESLEATRPQGQLALPGEEHHPVKQPPNG